MKSGNKIIQNIYDEEMLFFSDFNTENFCLRCVRKGV